MFLATPGFTVFHKSLTEACSARLHACSAMAMSTFACSNLIDNSMNMRINSEIATHICAQFSLSLFLSLDDSSAGREGARPAGETEYSTDLTGKLGKVLQSSNPL